MRTSVPENYENNYWSLVSLITLGIFFVIFIGYNSISYVNFRIQQKFKCDNKRLIELYKFNDVEIYQDSYTIKPFRQNYDARINIKPRIDKFEILKVKNSLILLGQVSEMGLFRVHLRPILIDYQDTDLTFQRTIKPKILEAVLKDSDLIIRFEKSIKGINTLIIKNYNKFET
jgi:hypothetical protein